MRHRLSYIAIIWLAGSNFFLYHRSANSTAMLRVYVFEILALYLLIRVINRCFSCQIDLIFFTCTCHPERSQSAPNSMYRVVSTLFFGSVLFESPTSLIWQIDFYNIVDFTIAERKHVGIRVTRSTMDDELGQKNAIDENPHLQVVSCGQFRSKPESTGIQAIINSISL